MKIVYLIRILNWMFKMKDYLIKRLFEQNKIHFSYLNKN